MRKQAKSKRIIAKRAGRKWSVKAVAAPKKRKKEPDIFDAIAQVRNEIKEAAAHSETWNNITADTQPGLYVQRSQPTGIPVYEVVRIVSTNNGVATHVGVFTPDQKEEHNPLIVCHSSYQRIEE